MNPDTLERWNEEYKFAYLEFEVLKCVAENPAMLSQIADGIYADRKDGGPLGAESCVYTYISQVNKKLTGIARIKPKTFYELVLDSGTDKRGIIIP